MDFLEFFNKIAYTLYLSFLWFICCIPIFTIGASTTAYCYMLNKVVWGNEGYITRGFFKAFKSNFKTSTKVWLVFVIAIAIVMLDYYFIVYMSGQMGGMYYALIPVYILMLCLLWAMLIYAFPYMSIFEDTVKNILKNSFLMSTRHFGYTLLMMIINGAILFVGIYMFAGVLVIAPGLIGVVNVGILSMVLKRYEDPERYQV